MGFEDAVRSIGHDVISLEECPRSVAIRVPESPAILVAGFRAMAQMPVECNLSFDQKRQMLVMGTGTRLATLHPELTSPESLQPYLERASTRALTHNHPALDGWVQSLPSPSDWVALAAMAGIYAFRTSWIISSAGITRYAFPADKRIDNDFFFGVQLLQRDHQIELHRSGMGAFPKDDQERDMVKSVSERFGRDIGGSVEIIPWSDTERIESCAAEFLALCK